MIKSLLTISDSSVDTLISNYLTLAKDEILNYRYNGEIPEEVTDVPTRYEMVQVMAVVTGYSMNGAENETTHTENAITRQFRYADMIAYIRSKVIPLAKVV